MFEAYAGAVVDASQETRASEDDGLRLARQGRRLELLYRHLASSGLRSRYEAEDAVQEVFLRALASRAGWPQPAGEPEDVAMRRYLSVLLRNVVIDLARRVRAARRDGRPLPLSRSSVSAGVAASGLWSPGPGPATRAAEAEDEAALQRAYDALAPVQRRVIGLRQFEGLSAAQAAQRMGRSESAVHSLYRRALLAWEDGLRGRSG